MNRAQQALDCIVTACVVYVVWLVFVAATMGGGR